MKINQKRKNLRQIPKQMQTRERLKQIKNKNKNRQNNKKSIQNWYKNKRI